MLKTFRSYNKLKTAILDNTTNCVEITKQYLKAIDKKKELNAFIEVFEKECLARAKKVDDKIKKGTAGRLAGMVIGIKDNICYKNHKVGASSKILEGFTSLYSATVINRLLKEDAIIIGRLNCDEFAMGSANENTIHGRVKNPFNLDKVSGGSSGGSSVAVSAGLCLASLGSDTGGSIRQPSAFCGVVGIKPTYSRVSRYGLIAYASSFDQIGPITNNIEDAALILEVISGKDKFDSTTSSKKVEKFTSVKKTNKPKKIGYILDYFEREGLDKEIRKKTMKLINNLKLKGHVVQPITFPYIDVLVPTYYVLTTAEASSNLARFDGVHYGFRSKETNSLEEIYFKSRTKGFGEEVKRRIMLGTFVLSSGYYDEYFTKAQKIRRIIKNSTDNMFKKHDFIISPTTPHTAFSADKKYKDPTTMYLEDIYTVHANLSGNPAISLPLMKHSNGMPIGIQVMADNFKEKELIAFSKNLLN